jgi:fatty-acid peroxygenase
MPSDPRPDATLAWRADPYRYIGRTARSLGSDVFATRIGARRTICLTGPAAAALFYDPRRFERRGAAPAPVRATLFGRDAIQGTDGAEHLTRKAMFLALMTRPRIELLATLFASELADATEAWAQRPRVVLDDAIRPVLARAVCRWAGVPLAGRAVAPRTHELAALFEGAGSLGPAHLRAVRARASLERWLAELVTDLRAGRWAADPRGALHAVATVEDAHGRPLGPRTAAVELLNVLRPTVAVGVWIAFAAHALAVRPAVRARLRSGDTDYARAFAQEVRRWYPFFPAVVARVRVPFTWRGAEFERGTRALLDLYGTNRDPRTWTAPDEFRPERFLGRAPDPYGFVPQGGGHADSGHRCPGEWVSLALIGTAVDVLARRLDAGMPPQDLAIDYHRLPARPASGIVLGPVRPLSPAAARTAAAAGAALAAGSPLAAAGSAGHVRPRSPTAPRGPLSPRPAESGG